MLFHAVTPEAAKPTKKATKKHLLIRKPHESSIFDTYLDVNDNLPDNLNFGGEAINILSQDREGWTSDEVSVASINSTPINDAIYLRNQTVSDRINVKIKPNKVQNDSPDEVIKLAQTDVNSGLSHFISEY